MSLGGAFWRGILGSSLSACLLAACQSRDRFEIYVFEDGTPKPSEISYTKLEPLRNEKGNLSIHFEEPYEMDGHGTVVPVKVSLSTKSPEEGKYLSLFLMSSIPSRESTYYEFPCDLAARLCEGPPRQEIIPIRSRDTFWFPFDSLRIEHTFKFEPFVEWNEVTVYNEADSLAFEADLSLTLQKEVLSLTGGLQRSASYRLVFALVLILGFGCWWFAYRRPLRGKAKAAFFLSLLVAGLLLELAIFRVALAPFNLANVSIGGLVLGAVVTHALRRARQRAPSYRKDRAPPANWQDFEDLCYRLWRPHLEDIEKNGRTGQPQAGVDVYGRDPETKGWVGIQCKQKGQWPPQVLTIRQIQDEIRKAAGFKPRLSLFVIATTARRDVKSQEYVRRLDFWRRRSGNFLIKLCAWDDIEDRLEAEATPDS